MSFDIMNVQIEEPKTQFDDYSYTIYGIGGAGKTTLFAELFNDPAFLTFDNNHEHIRGKKLPAPDWRTVRQYLTTLSKASKEGKPMPFTTILVDTADVASNLCQDYTCKVNGWSHPSEGAYGAGWSAVRAEWSAVWKGFRDCGIKVNFICHDKDKEFKPRNQEAYNQVVPNLGATFMGEVFDGVNFVLYLDTEVEKDETGAVIREKRVLHSRKTDRYLAKSHLANFPEHIDFLDTPKATARFIVEAFNKAIIEENEADKKTKPTKPKAQPKAEIPKVEDVASPEPKVEAEVSTVTLESLKEEIEVILKGAMASKKMGASDIINVIEKYTGVKMIKDIPSKERALELLAFIKQ